MIEVVAVGREGAVTAVREGAVTAKVGIDEIGGDEGVEWVVLTNGDEVVGIETDGWQVWKVSDKGIWQEVWDVRGGLEFVGWDVEVEYGPRMEG